MKKNYIPATDGRSSTNPVSNNQLIIEIEKSKQSYGSYLNDDSKIPDVLTASLPLYSATDDDNKIPYEGEFHKQSELQKIFTEHREKRTGIKSTHADVVYRVYTNEHFGEMDFGLTKTGKKSKKSSNYEGYKQFRWDGKQWTETGRSHWIGSFSNGYFSHNHGTLTNTLSLALQKLAERLCMKGNYRGYPDVDDWSRECLLQLLEKALSYNEFKSDNPFAYYTQICINVLNFELTALKKRLELQNKILLESGYHGTFGGGLEYADD